MKKVRKGFNYLLISFFATVVTSFTSKLGAISFDKALFMFIAYSLGSLIAIWRYTINSKKQTKEIKIRSRKFGILIGIVNFLAYYTFLTALSIGPGSLVLPLVTLNVAPIVVLSMIIFKERLNWKGILGFILAIIAIWLLI